MANSERLLSKEKDLIFEVHARAPVRICDLGGWTDTWFAEKGAVLNFAVSPGVEATTQVYRRTDKRPQVTLHAIDLGQNVEFDLNKPRLVENDLLQASIQRFGVPANYRVEISVHSEPPPGCSVGTSASVTVALLAALAKISGRQISPEFISSQAHLVETDDLKRQCGIQDQLAAAFGGISFIEMPSYPRAMVESVQISKKLWDELDKRFCTFYLGKPHFSSVIHEMIIAKLQTNPKLRKTLELLASFARLGKEDLIKGNLTSFGTLMTLNTEAQRRLDARLIPIIADEMFEIARSYNAAGWKVNGAGGPDGGSVTILGPTDLTKNQRMIREILRLPQVRHLGFLHLSQKGIEVTSTEQ